MRPVPLTLALVAMLLAGCSSAEDDPTPATGGSSPTSPTPIGPALVFGGFVKDAVTRELIPDAMVRIDLAQAQPCARQGVGWNSWEAPIVNGSYGPLELPRPRSDDVAFFLHAVAPGYAENATFIGPAQARAGLAQMTVFLHPDASVNGTAPPGTLLALDAPGFPDIALASANGTFSFAHARAFDAWFVAGTDVPYRALLRAPKSIDVPRVTEGGWTLEGTTKAPNGAGIAADIIARNGTMLVGVTRSGASGAFALALTAQPADLKIEARTSDDHYGGVLAIKIEGRPALRETILLKALC